MHRYLTQRVVFTRISLALTVFTLVGCSNEPAPEAQFEPNLVHAMRHQIKEGFSTAQASEDAMWLVTEMFGTPDNPKLPESDEDIADLISLERLKKAAGPIAQGSGLYRKHCASCHGITGNGRGATAAIINPYPRDYRLGIFKFKSTKRSAKPIRSDLVHQIANGIQGTPMAKIPELSDDDFEALTDYVIYLSIRGELERTLVDLAIFDLDLEEGERLYDYQMAKWIGDLAETRKSHNENTDDYVAATFKPEQLVIDGETIDEDLIEDFRDFKEDAKLLVNNQSIEEELADFQNLVSTYHEMRKPFLQANADDEEEAEEPSWEDKLEALVDGFDLYDGAWEDCQDESADIVASWLDAADDIVEVPDPPSSIPVPKSRKEFVQFTQGDQADALADSVKRGQELFVGKVASCGKCHGEKGLGNGTTNDYDDWTKDWTSRAGLKPEDRERLIPLLARGALPPRNALPRNFAEGIFRGGSTPQDLYRRIMAGIAGTPMPAATFVDGQFEQDDVWHIINFVRSLQTAPVEQTPKTEQTAAK